VLRLNLHPEGMAPRSPIPHQEPGGTESVPAYGVVLALRYRRGEQELALFSISAAVDTATAVTVEELAIETCEALAVGVAYSSERIVDRARRFRREYTGPATSYVRDFDDQPRSALLLDGAHVPHRDLGSPWPARPDSTPG
jgi:hypothetical protein